MRRSAITPGMQFVVPLRPRGFAILVVAKYAARARILVGYCFGPARRTLPTQMTQVKPRDTCLIGQISDGGIVSGEWQLLGGVPNFDRDDWPAERFQRSDDLGRWFIETYDDDDPNELISSVRTSADQVVDLPRNTLHDPWTLASELSTLLAAKELLWDRGCHDHRCAVLDEE